jgi:hypothetical protein
MFSAISQTREPPPARSDVPVIVGDRLPLRGAFAVRRAARAAPAQMTPPRLGG